MDIPQVDGNRNLPNEFTSVKIVTNSGKKAIIDIPIGTKFSTTHENFVVNPDGTYVDEFYEISNNKVENIVLTDEQYSAFIKIAGEDNKLDINDTERLSSDKLPKGFEVDMKGLFNIQFEQKTDEIVPSSLSIMLPQYNNGIPGQKVGETQQAPLESQQKSWWKFW